MGRQIVALPKQDLLLGLSRSEVSAYLALLRYHPANGSLLSKHSGVRRPNIYDVLRTLKQKGYVSELGKGLYVPLPPEELLKRLKTQINVELADFEKQVQAAQSTLNTEYVWTIKGYGKVIDKAREMIGSAEKELYLQLYREEAHYLDEEIQKALRRGVEIKYVSMGEPLTQYDLMVVHPNTEALEEGHGGRVFDVVRDKIEILVGMFAHGREDESPVNWAQNHWFVMAIREGIRHDFFHFFVHKLLDRGQSLTEKELRIYNLIKNDAWAEHCQPQ
jgi:sugar-specific transcriptional regulator TrmB